MTVRYLDYESGNDSNDGTSFANRKKTLGSLSSSVVAGDEVRIKKSPDATSLGINATFTKKSLTVTLASALTANIYLDGAWTASANVTATVSTSTKKEGANSSQIAFAAGFTTGLAAYYATGTLDLSGYKQVSFWIRSTVALAASVLRLDLCSDAAGATPANSFTISTNIPANTWVCLTYDYGSALHSAVQSVALNCLSDPGTPTVVIDNIIACKDKANADAITLNHLIGKNDGFWYPIRNINGTTVELDSSGVASNTGVGQGYHGATATVTGYIKKPIPFSGTLPGSQTANIDVYSGPTGTSGSHITISGGWDDTNMSTQPAGADTLIDAVSGYGILLNNSNSRDYLDYSKIGIVRGARLLGPTTPSSIDFQTVSDCSGIGCVTDPIGATSFGSNWAIDGLKIIACGSGIALPSGLNFSLSNSYVLSCTGIGISISTNTGAETDLLLTNVEASCNTTSGFSLTEAVVGSGLVANDNAGSGISFVVGITKLSNVTLTGNGIGGISSSTGGAKIYGLTTSGNTTAAILENLLGASEIIVYDANISEATPVSYSNSNAAKNVVRLHRSSTYADNKTYEYWGTISMQSATVPSGSTYAWEYAPNKTNGNALATALGRRTPIATQPCKSGVNNTFTFKCRRSNTNLTCRLVVYGGRYPGISSDIITNVNPAAGSFADYSITVNPTENCVVEIFFEVYHNGTLTYTAQIGQMVRS